MIVCLLLDVALRLLVRVVGHSDFRYFCFGFGTFPGFVDLLGFWDRLVLGLFICGLTSSSCFRFAFTFGLVLSFTLCSFCLVLYSAFLSCWALYDSMSL